MTPIIVCGAGGKMGSRILELAAMDSNFKICGAVERLGHPSIGKKILDGKTQLQADIKQLESSEAVIIDFTTPEATVDHLKSIQNWKRAALVIGTTGLSSQDIGLIQEISKKFPIVFSPNMSVGVNLMFDLVRQVAQKLASYDIEIVEAHHNQKKDAPSGTALGLAKEISDALQRKIPIHSIRAGDVVGDHTVIFATNGERIELTHRASSRDAFANGALRAAEWVSRQKPGLYSMKDVLVK